MAGPRPPENLPLPEEHGRGEVPMEEILETLSKEGNAQDYEKFVAADPDFFLGTIVKQLRDQGERTPFESYARQWIQFPERASLFIEASWPKAKGFKAFVEGLRMPPFNPDGTQNADFLDSHEVLKRILAKLNERDRYLHATREKREELIRKESAVSENIKSGVSNLIRRFQEGSLTEKALTVLAAGVVVKVALWLKDKKLPGFKDEKYKWGLIGKLALAGWAINAISAKVSKDGKTLLQRLSMGTPVEDVKGSFWGIFALEGQREGRMLTKPNEQRVMFAFASKDIRDVAEMYQRYTAESRQAFSKEDLERMGFSPDEVEAIDGKIAYLVVDKLIKMAGRNYFTMLRVEEAKKRGIKPGEIRLEEFANTFEELGYRAIYDKYLTGVRASQKWTFEEVMVEEILEEARVKGGIDEWHRSVYADWDASKLPRRAYGGAKEAGSEALAVIQEAGGKVKKKLWTFGGFIAERFRRAYEHADRKIDEIRGIHKTFDEPHLRGILTESTYGMKVEVVSAGKVRIMDFPTTYKKQGEDQTLVYTIEEIPMSPMQPGKHGEIRKKLHEAIKKKVSDAVSQKAKSLPGRKPDLTKLKWDKTNGVWYIPDIKVDGNIHFEIPKRTDVLDIRFDDHGTARFEIEGREVKDFDKIETDYQLGVMANRIREQFPKLDTVIGTKPADSKLRINMVGIQEISGVGPCVLGDIEGARFAATHVSPDKVEFFDPSNFSKKGPEVVKLKGSNYAREKVNQIASSRVFNEVFDEAHMLVENTPTLSREEKKQWRYLLEFKRSEMLAFFEDNLKEADHLQKAFDIQDSHVGNRLVEIQNKINYFRALHDLNPAGPDKKKEITNLLGFLRDWLYDKADPQYRRVYHELLSEVLESGRYKLGSLTAPATDDDQKILNKIRNIWSARTRKYAEKESLSSHEVNMLEKVKNRILAKLDELMRKGGVGVGGVEIRRITSAEFPDTL